MAESGSYTAVSPLVSADLKPAALSSEANEAIISSKNKQVTDLLCIDSKSTSTQPQTPTECSIDKNHSSQSEELKPERKPVIAKPNGTLKCRVTQVGKEGLTKIAPKRHSQPQQQQKWGSSQESVTNKLQKQMGYSHRQIRGRLGVKSEQTAAKTDKVLHKKEGSFSNNTGNDNSVAEVNDRNTSTEFKGHKDNAKNADRFMCKTPSGNNTIIWKEEITQVSSVSCETKVVKHLRNNREYSPISREVTTARSESGHNGKASNSPRPLHLKRQRTDLKVKVLDLLSAGQKEDSEIETDKISFTESFREQLLNKYLDMSTFRPHTVLFDNHATKQWIVPDFARQRKKPNQTAISSVQSTRNTKDYLSSRSKTFHSLGSLKISNTSEPSVKQQGVVGGNKETLRQSDSSSCKMKYTKVPSHHGNIRLLHQANINRLRQIAKDNAEQKLRMMQSKVPSSPNDGDIIAKMSETNNAVAKKGKPSQNYERIYESFRQESIKLYKANWKEKSNVNTWKNKPNQRQSCKDENRTRKVPHNGRVTVKKGFKCLPVKTKTINMKSIGLKKHLLPLNNETRNHIIMQNILSLQISLPKMGMEQDSRDDEEDDADLTEDSEDESALATSEYTQSFPTSVISEDNDSELSSDIDVDGTDASTNICGQTVTIERAKSAPVLCNGRSCKKDGSLLRHENARCLTAGRLRKYVTPEDISHISNCTIGAGESDSGDLSADFRQLKMDSRSVLQSQLCNHCDYPEASVEDCKCLINTRGSTSTAMNIDNKFRDSEYPASLSADNVTFPKINGQKSNYIHSGEASDVSISYTRSKSSSEVSSFSSRSSDDRTIARQGHGDSGNMDRQVPSLPPIGISKYQLKSPIDNMQDACARVVKKNEILKQKKYNINFNVESTGSSRENSFITVSGVVDDKHISRSRRMRSKSKENENETDLHSSRTRTSRDRESETDVLLSSISDRSEHLVHSRELSEKEGASKDFTTSNVAGVCAISEKVSLESETVHLEQTGSCQTLSGCVIDKMDDCVKDTEVGCPVASDKFKQNVPDIVINVEDDKVEPTYTTDSITLNSEKTSMLCIPQWQFGK